MANVAGYHCDGQPFQKNTKPSRSVTSFAMERSLCQMLAGVQLPRYRDLTYTERKTSGHLDAFTETSRLQMGQLSTKSSTLLDDFVGPLRRLRRPSTTTSSGPLDDFVDPPPRLRRDPSTTSSTLHHDFVGTPRRLRRPSTTT